VPPSSVPCPDMHRTQTCTLSRRDRTYSRTVAEHNPHSIQHCTVIQCSTVRIHTTVSDHKHGQTCAMKAGQDQDGIRMGSGWDHDRIRVCQQLMLCMHGDEVHQCTEQSNARHPHPHRTPHTAHRTVHTQTHTHTHTHTHTRTQR